VVVGFGWTEGRAAQNYNAGLVEVFRVNAGAAASTTPVQTSTTEPAIPTTIKATTTVKASTIPPETSLPATAGQGTEETTTTFAAGVDNPVSNSLWGVLMVLILLVVLVAVAAFFLLRKKNPPEKKEETHLSTAGGK